MNTKATRKGTESDIQSNFLASIRSRIPKHLSLSDELAELLHISRDSAYRRMREETLLSLNEVKILCNRYSVSVDALLARDSGNVLFELNAQYGPGIPFKSWLESILAHLKSFDSEPDAALTWHSKEMPIFHFFQFSRLAAFKLFWWMNLLNGGDIGKETYDERNVGKDLIGLSERIWDIYSRLPSTQIISRELMNTTLRQIEYGYETGFLAKSQAAALFRECADLLRQFERQIQHGFKKLEDPQKPAGKFDVYVNELLIGDNTILFQAGERQTTFVTHNNFTIMSTSQPSFCQQTDQFMNSMIQKSVLISRTAEKQRNKFFNKIHEQIDEVHGALGPDKIAC